jgi:rRNA maturation endonuclease Nob1
MNKTVCWFCEKEFEYEDPKYRDTNCPYCGVENSIMNPEQPDWLPSEEEEEMSINYNDEKYAGKYVYLPKMGETAVFDIEEIHEVKSDNPKFNFTENVPVMANGEQVVDDDGEAVFKKKDLGYHVEAKLKDGKLLSVTSLGAFFSVFKKHNIQDGDKVRIEHPEKGIWKVEKLGV